MLYRQNASKNHLIASCRHNAFVASLIILLRNLLSALFVFIPP